MTMLFYDFLRAVLTFILGELVATVSVCYSVFLFLIDLRIGFADTALAVFLFGER